MVGVHATDATVSGPRGLNKSQTTLVNAVAVKNAPDPRDPRLTSRDDLNTPKAGRSTDAWIRPACAFRN